MKKKLPLFIFAVIHILFSCKKENPKTYSCNPLLIPTQSEDTVFPSEYFPAYPGSYWKLVFNYNGGSDTLIVKATGWKSATANFPVTLEKCGIYMTKTSKIPVITGGSQKAVGYTSSFENIWGNDFLMSASQKKPASLPTLVKTFYPYNTLTNLYYQFDSIENGDHPIKITCMTFALDSILIEGTWYHNYYYKNIRLTETGHYGDYPILDYSMHYAKDVGLIRYSIDNKYITYNLVDYYIAPH